MELTQQQKLRYNRHLILDGFGREGQERLLGSKVLIVGAGGLGSPVALYLAAAGVGVIGIADGDVVSISNLQRQIIHTTADVDRLKAESAKDKINALNPDVKVTLYREFLDETNAESIISEYDFILDCTDNFKVKYLINDTCVRLAKPFCMGGVGGWAGQIMTHVKGSACYRCIFPEQESYEATGAAILGVVPGMMGTIQAAECIKYLIGVGDLLTNTLLTFDAMQMQWHRMEIAVNPHCRTCGRKD